MEIQQQTQTQIQNYIPPISWYQTETHICLEVLVSDPSNVVFDVETAEDGITSTFLFEADVGSKHYLICFQLFDTVIDEMCSHMVFGNRVKVLMKKKEDDKEWSRLSHTKDLYKNSIKVNWDKMEVENDTSPFGDMDMERMMKQMEMQRMMQGMQGISGMSGNEGTFSGEEDENEEEDEEEGEGDNMDKLHEIMEQVKGEDGQVDMEKFEQVMKGMSLEDFQEVMDGMDEEKVEELMGEDE